MAPTAKGQATFALGRVPTAPVIARFRLAWSHGGGTFHANIIPPGGIFTGRHIAKTPASARLSETSIATAVISDIEQNEFSAGV